MGDGQKAEGGKRRLGRLVELRCFMCEEILTRKLRECECGRIAASGVSSVGHLENAAEEYPLSVR